MLANPAQFYKTKATTRGNSLKKIADGYEFMYVSLHCLSGFFKKGSETP
jgi:hypothetical protein